MVGVCHVLIIYATHLIDIYRPMAYNSDMSIIIKTTPAFDRKSEKIMSKQALEDFYDHISQHPDIGPVIPGTAGVRKIRWKSGLNDKGKSGGIRILYHCSDDILVILITMYEKSEKDNITQAERNELKRMLPLLVSKYRGEL